KGDLLLLHSVRETERDGPSCYVSQRRTNNHPTDCLFSPIVSDHIVVFLWPQGSLDE
ncbi:Uncharacterized protein DAT39_001774, partial [Clarias magur]